MPRPDQQLHKQIGARMTSSELDFCLQIGGGNAAHGVRVLIKRAMSEQGFQHFSAADHLRMALLLIEREAQQ